MNKYKVIILSLLISFMGASCEDWLYDNVNEDAAHEVLPQQVLPVVLFYSAQLQFDHAEYGAYLTQTLTTGGRNQTSSFAYKSGWGDFLTMNRPPQWRPLLRYRCQCQRNHRRGSRSTSVESGTHRPYPSVNVHPNDNRPVRRHASFGSL